MTARTRDIVEVARELLEQRGWEAVTVREIADRLGIKAPSLYKHVPGKPALAGHLTATALAEMGAALHTSVADGVGAAALLAAYRAYAHGSPHLYRLATTGELDTALLPPGLEEWAGTPFFTVTGDPYAAQALWATTHGLTVLELDRRFPTGTAPDLTWGRAATAYVPGAGGDVPPGPVET